MTTDFPLSVRKAKANPLAKSQDPIPSASSTGPAEELIKGHDDCNSQEFITDVRDAHNISTSDKYSAKGYFCLGKTYEAQGEEQQAIDAYNKGLLCVASTDSFYDQLIEAKYKLTERNNTYIDFIATLPFEIVQDVFVDLPKESKSACLHVSRTWRSKILNCDAVWAVMAAENTIHDNCFAAVLPSIAKSVESLTMDTKNSQIWSQYIQQMKAGSFKRIKALYWKTVDPFRSPPSLIYSQIKNTLTKLDLLDVDTIVATFTIADLLYTCSNLTQLRYQNSKDHFEDILGDFSDFGAQKLPLLDLAVNCSTTGESIAPVLLRCPQLQRLILNRCTDSALDVVYETCQNLRIFAFNPNSYITALENLDVSDERPGLLEFYTTSGGYGAPPQGVLPLIRRSMETLRVVVANISLTEMQARHSAPYFDKSDHSYDDLRFPYLERLSYWADPRAAFDPILLRSISTCTSLRAFTVVQLEIMEKAIDILLTLPPVEELDFSFTWEKRSITYSLIRLFEYYAAHSRTHNICLSHCHSANDKVLDALADIKSLRTIALWELSGVSHDGLDRFLKKVSGVVTSLNLSKMYIADDTHLATVATMQGLKKLKLQLLYSISDFGVSTVIDISTSLEHLIIAQCFSLTETVYESARRMVPKFELNTIIDYD